MIPRAAKIVSRGVVAAVLAMLDPAGASYGTGLQGMADRLEALGGRLSIDSAPGRGTTLTGRVPIPRGNPR